jgi:putative ABC transport system substrate-binding protein
MNRITCKLLAAFMLAMLAGWVSTAAAQTRPMRLGILFMNSEEDSRQYQRAFFRRLASLGWIEGKNVVFFFASARGDPARFPEAASELVRQRVDVIYADSAPAVRAAHAATRTVPIVGQDFTTDPVAAGYAESVNRPGGNLTGVFLDAPQISAKWMELLTSVIPGLSRAVALWDPSAGDTHLRAVQDAARAAGVQIQVLEVRRPEDIDNAASSNIAGQPQALIVIPSPIMYLESARVGRFAMKQRLPATSMAQQFAEQGGVLAFGPEQASNYERCAALVSSVLGGAKPGELPIERPAKFDLVVNVRAAKKFGLKVPDHVLARADRVIR